MNDLGSHFETGLDPRPSVRFVIIGVIDLRLDSSEFQSDDGFRR